MKIKVKTKQRARKSIRPRPRPLWHEQDDEQVDSSGGNSGGGSGGGGPYLRFTPYAWAKLIYFCHRDETEIGGFGITAEDDPMLIEDFVTVKQEVSIASVAFDDEAVADFFEDQVDAGRQPSQFGRIWLHTHPGDSPYPSSVDEETFDRVFGGCDWAVMFILAEGGDTYARLRFNVGPGAAIELPVSVDYEQPFAGSDHLAWEVEYQANIEIEDDLLEVCGEDGMFSVFDEDPIDVKTLMDRDAWLIDLPDEEEKAAGI